MNIFSGFKNIPHVLKDISGKVSSFERITMDEALILFNQADIGFLGILADIARKKKNRDFAYYIQNVHIEPTNKCIHQCKFCSYSEKYSGQGWELTLDDIKEKTHGFPQNIREIHITGAVHSTWDLDYYCEILKNVKEIRPDVHLKAYSAIELDYMFKKAAVSDDEGFRLLKDAGLDSVPGGGAEIFDEDIRKKICPDKTTSQRWLDIHKAAHRNGIVSNATMLYGHIESYEQRIDHMNRLRALQDETGGFRAFIPLKYKKVHNPLGDGISEASVLEDMRSYAVARIFLDNFQHIKAYWPMLGKENAQLSLSFGVDDLDGTINDSTKIYSLAGAEEQNPAMTIDQIKGLIRDAGLIPVERDSLYTPSDCLKTINS